MVARVQLVAPPLAQMVALEALGHLTRCKLVQHKLMAAVAADTEALLVALEVPAVVGQDTQAPARSRVLQTQAVAVAVPIMSAQRVVAASLSYVTHLPK